MTGTRTPDELVDDAEAFARTFGVSVRDAIDALQAIDEMERLARERHVQQPDTTLEQAMAELLRTPEGSVLYARANPRASRKTKAVQASQRSLYLARAALSQALPSDRCRKVTEAGLVDEALKLFVDVLAEDETPPRNALVAAFRKV